MKIFLTTILLLTSFNIFSATIKIIGPCSETPIHQSNLENLDISKNLNDITTDYLERNKIPYLGNAYGIISINESPIGDDAIEILSDTQLRAYGWCFSINGSQIDKMPYEVQLNDQQDQITWFYAFATYDNGEWKDYCTPAYKIQSTKICSSK
jgi:hypothetical protein